jgi:hypothetical protein
MSATTPLVSPPRSSGGECTRGALLSSDDYGSSVERTATLHPLCKRVRTSAAGKQRFSTEAVMLRRMCLRTNGRRGVFGISGEALADSLGAPGRSNDARQPRLDLQPSALGGPGARHCGAAISLLLLGLAVVLVPTHPIGLLGAAGIAVVLAGLGVEVVLPPPAGCGPHQRAARASGYLGGCRGWPGVWSRATRFSTAAEAQHVPDSRSGRAGGSSFPLRCQRHTRHLPTALP